MELLYWQLIFIISLFLLALTGSFWPLMALKWKMKGNSKDIEDFKDSKVISLGNSLACGVFFALCFLHLIPHSGHKWEKIFDGENPYASLLPRVLILVSFSLMLFIEKTEVVCQEKSMESLPIIVLTKASVAEDEEESSLEMKSSSTEDISNNEEDPSSASFHRDYISFGDLQLVSENPKQ